MRILLAIEKEREAQLLSAAFETLDHRILTCSDLNEGVKLLHDWRPDLLVADERLRFDHPESGLRLAELCRIASERNQGRFGTQAVVLVPTADWERIRRAQRTGAHGIVKGANFDAVLRYVQAVADNLTTDRMLGPILFGIHGFPSRIPAKFCTGCTWVGASIAYGASQADLELTPVRATVLNALLGCRRGQSAAEIYCRVKESPFLKSLLGGRILKASAVKMEITRLRQDIAEALSRIGAPYNGHHFLPPVAHGVERYRLMGNWQLSHLPFDLTDPA